MSESQAVAPVNAASLDVPEHWNRQGDVVMAFAEHLDTRWRIAQMLVKSGMVRQKRPEAIMAIQLKAFEMGVPLMQALGGMYFVDGKVSLEGHLMDALAIQRCGVTKTIEESTDERCRIVLHREGWDDLPSEYTVEDAASAGLVTIKDGKVTARKPNWTKYRKRMLYWRALSNGLSQIAPDYFGGVYLYDELEESAAIRSAIDDNRSTNEELDRLIAKGTGEVEPDDDEMSEDEMDAYASEVRAAHKAELIDSSRADELYALAIDGKWSEARGAWDEIRSLIARAEADSEGQGALAV